VRALVAVFGVVLVAIAGLAVTATATTTRNGLPAYTDGYASWHKLNKRPLTAPGAHNGVKHVYASRRRAASRRFPNGTVIVKSIAEPGAKGFARQVAVMRKAQGRWRWVEYELDGGRYRAFASGALCSSCHMQARANDWVFTKG
jgi:capsular polysaccharide biosynthesis protein